MASVLFIQDNWLEHLGIEYLAASLKRAGHTCSLIIANNSKTVIQAVQNQMPDILAFSATTGSHSAYLKLAGSIRSHLLSSSPPGSTIPLFVLGGPHATFFPEVICDPVLDIICRGEGETALVELCNRISMRRDFNSVPGLWVKRNDSIHKNPLSPLIKDLDTIPFPDRTIYTRSYRFFRKMSMQRVLFSRGCPYECTYCYNSCMRKLTHGLGAYQRQRGIESVIEELSMLKSGAAKTFNIVDDTFGLRREWSINFLEIYSRKIGLPFIINTRAELLDADLVSALAKARCYCVQIGVESGNETLRKEVLGKTTTDATLLNAAGLVHKYNIKLLTYNMMGIPGETLEQAFMTIDINYRMKTDFPRVSIFQPYPRTVLGERARTAGLIGDNIGADEFSSSYFRRSILSQTDIRSMENLQKLFYPAIRWPRFKPLILRLVRRRPNPLFHIIFFITIGLQYMRATNQTFLETVRLGLKNLRSY
jgi:anaerobic magnesium-protoporphyrin IX monomethyl ester cyclase